MRRDPGISFIDVSKKYRRGERHDSLRDLIPALFKGIPSRARQAHHLSSDEFWAVREVSFEVTPGEVLGIIGGNGAGKSTILKLISGIIRPTRGESQVRGRVAALIEVSGSFHRDLTGRENIYLQGAVMGMSRQLIRKRFDDIVDFSGIAEFIDTPVKRYSSGMLARLGFSVAAHLEPDVLLIDEVLSVGDTSFQNRAYRRVEELATSGLPVVTVSHELDRVAKLCTKALVLDHGRVVKEGTAGDCVAWYLTEAGTTEGVGLPSGPLVIDSFTLRGPQLVNPGERIGITLVGRAKACTHAPERLSIQLVMRAVADDSLVFSTDSSQFGVLLRPDSTFVLHTELDMNVRSGLYSIHAQGCDNSGIVYARGPVVLLQIRNDPRTAGSAYLNPRIELIVENTTSEYV